MNFHAVVFGGVTASSARSGRAFRCDSRWRGFTVDRLEPRLWEAVRSFRRKVPVEADEAGLCGL